MNEYIALSGYAKDITGQRFGRLVALGPTGRDRHKKILWQCQCDCGETTSVIASDLLRNHTLSCGCLQVEGAIDRASTHGLAGSSTYLVWASIVKRCTNPNCKAFRNYGGRGIAICDEWRYDFQKFHNHIISLPDYGRKGYTLDRIDNDKGYEPGNLRWATRSQQARNSRNAKFIEFDGFNRCIREWEECTGIQESTIRARLRLGWSIEKALTTPARKVSK